MINEHCKPDAENSVEVHLLTVTLCDVVDELHNEDGLSNPSTSKKTDLPAFLVWRQKVNHLVDVRHMRYRVSL